MKVFLTSLLLKKIETPSFGIKRDIKKMPPIHFKRSEEVGSEK